MFFLSGHLLPEKDLIVFMFLWYNPFLLKDLLTAEYIGLVPLFCIHFKPHSYAMNLYNLCPQHHTYHPIQPYTYPMAFGVSWWLLNKTCPNATLSCPTLPTNILLSQSFTNHLMTIPFFQLLKPEESCHPWFPFSQHPAYSRKCCLLPSK